VKRLLAKVFSAVCRSSYRHPLRWLAAAVLISIPAAWLVSGITIDTNLIRLLPRQSRAGEWTRALDQVVSDGGYYTILIEGKDHRALVGAVQRMAARAAAIEGVRSVEYEYPIDFIRHYRYLLIPGEYLNKILDELIGWEAEVSPIGLDLMKDARKKSDYQADEDKREIDSQLDTYGNLPLYHQSRDGLTMGILVRPMRGVTSFGTMRKIHGRLETIAGEEAAAAGIWTGVGGSLRNKINEYDLIVSDLNVTGTISTVAIIAFLVLSFRSVTVIPFLLFPVAVGLLWSYALVPTIVGSLNTVTSFLLLVLFGVGVENPIHLVKRFQFERMTRKPYRALRKTFLSTGPSVIISGLTTAVPLLILTVSRFRGFSEFGLIAGVAILMMMTALLIIMPSCLVIGDRLRMIRPTPEGRLRSWLPKPAVSAALGLVVLAALVVIPLKLRFDYDFSNLKATIPESEAIRERQRKVYPTSMSPAALYVAPDLTSLDAALAVLDARKREEGTTFGKVTSLRDWAPTTAGAEERLDLIGQIREQVSGSWVNRVTDPDRKRWIDDLRTWRPPEARPTLEGLPEIIRARYLAQDGSGRYLVGIFPNVERKHGKNAMAFTSELYGLKMPDGVEGPVGETPVFAEIIWIVLGEGPWLVLCTLIGVIGLIYLHSRSKRVTFIIVIPLVSGVVLALAVMALSGIKLNFFNVIVIPTLLGMGVDFGVHYYRRYQELGKDLRSSHHELFEPLTTVTVTTIMGYSGMVFARHPGLESIGIAAVLGLIGNLLTYLILSPGIIRWLDEKVGSGLPHF
jgi:predicted RND superfamily exporter protein